MKRKLFCLILISLLGVATILLALPVTVFATEKIVFAHEENGDYDIWIMDPDGSHAQPLLARSGSNESSPAISHQGNRIAFFSNYGGRVEVWVMNSDGSNPLQITYSTDPWLTHSGPSWFPQDSLIAYAVRYGNSGALVIRGVHPDGTGDRLLIDSPNNLDCNPVVNPVNGCLIAHHSDPGDWGPDADTWISDICSGTHVTLIDGTLHEAGGPHSWSSDGSQITLISMVLNPPVNVWRINADGTGLTQLTTCTGDTVVWSPAWSPSNSHIVCCYSTSGYDGPYSICVMNSDGSNLHELYIPTTGNAFDPNWGVIPLYLCGNLSGTLSAVYSPYSVDCDITVPAGDTLIIEPGVTLNFMGPYKFEVQGILLAEGTVTDSIKFTTEQSGSNRWRGLPFSGSASSGSRLAYCLVEKGYATGSWPNNCGGGVYCEYCSPSFSNCTISGDSADYDGGGVMCWANSSPAFTNCTINGNWAPTGGGVYCYWSSPTFQNCTLSGNSASNCGGGMCCFYSSPSFSNCTFSGNSASICGGGVLCSNSSPAFTNTVIAFSQGAGIYFQLSPSSQVEYCDMFGNSGGNFAFYNDDPSNGPPAIGQLVTTNANGDPCDQYYNISLDPLFVNAGAGDYHLTANSPCIDAGDPTMFDPDCTPSDMGAFYFFHLAQPDSLITQQQGNDMLVRWSIVDSMECGFPSPIQSYVIYYEEELNEDWDFLAATTDTFYTHENVVLFAPTMFYEVVATDVEIGLVRSIAQPGISRADFEATLLRVQR